MTHLSRAMRLRDAAPTGSQDFSLTASIERMKGDTK